MDVTVLFMVSVFWFCSSPSNTPTPNSMEVKEGKSSNTVRRQRQKQLSPIFNSIKPFTSSHHSCLQSSLFNWNSPQSMNALDAMAMVLSLGQLVMTNALLVEVAGMAEHMVKLPSPITTLSSFFMPLMAKEVTYRQLCGLMDMEPRPWKGERSKEVKSFSLQQFSIDKPGMDSSRFS